MDAEMIKLLESMYKIEQQMRALGDAGEDPILAGAKEYAKMPMFGPDEEPTEEGEDLNSLVEKELDKQKTLLDIRRGGLNDLIEAELDAEMSILDIKRRAQEEQTENLKWHS